MSKLGQRIARFNADTIRSAASWAIVDISDGADDDSSQSQIRGRKHESSQKLSYGDRRDFERIRRGSGSCACRPAAERATPMQFRKSPLQHSAHGSLQNVPITITALTAETLTQLNVTTGGRLSENFCPTDRRQSRSGAGGRSTCAVCGRPRM